MTEDEIESDIETIDTITDLLDKCRKKINTLIECLPDTPQYHLAAAIDDALNLANDARTDLDDAKASDDEGSEA